MSRSLSVLLWLTLASSCASKVTIVPLSSRDPADPAAPEGTPPLRPGLTASEEEPDRNSDASSDTYTCPMHPEVERSEPGSCPICHMSLVKKSKEEQAP